jgi:hypothetical protein
VTAAGEAPLIVTAVLPPELQAQMDALRREHYPPERNQLPAHVTLFHALPPSCEGELRQVLARLTAHHPPPLGRVEGVMSLGSGTAIRLTSPSLLALRDELADHFDTLLSPQDQHTPRLHVTIQNKVAPREAKALQLQLGAQLQPSAFRFTGLALHAYLGGPWRLLKSSSFRG